MAERKLSGGPEEGHGASAAACLSPAKTSWIAGDTRLLAPPSRSKGDVARDGGGCLKEAGLMVGGRLGGCQMKAMGQREPEASSPYLPGAVGMSRGGIRRREEAGW